MQDMTDEVMRLRNEPGSEERNRCGILLATESTAKSTKTLSHVLWALYNLLPAKSFQKPHKHSALALDLAIYAPEGTYTMMGPDLNSQGDIIDPVRVDWATGGMFTTPPGVFENPQPLGTHCLKCLGISLPLFAPDCRASCNRLPRAEATIVCLND